MCMEVLAIEGTDDTPKVILDQKNGVFEISGRSLPEDAVEFYQPVLRWIDGYAKSPNPATEFIFKMEYSNTASAKLIQDVLIALAKIEGIRIVWYFQSDDEDVEEAGREFSDHVGIAFDFRSY